MKKRLEILLYMGITTFLISMFILEKNCGGGHSHYLY